MPNGHILEIVDAMAKKIEKNVSSAASVFTAIDRKL